MNKKYIILLLFATIKLHAQEVRKAINGKIQFNSTGIENVHVVNETSRRGTISNEYGDFKIMIKENDTLKFSNIQFKTKKIIITKNLLQKGELNISLLQRTNELDEVVIVKRKNMAVGLGLPNAGKKPLDKLESNLNAYSQKSTAIVILQAILLKSGGIDDIYNIVSGNRKRDRTLKKLLDEDKRIELQNQGVDDIIDHFKNDFFIYTLGIKAENIQPFVFFCTSNGIVDLYYKKRYMEIIDIFVKNKDPYLSSLQ